jgi:hypothetical protein
VFDRGNRYAGIVVGKRCSSQIGSNARKRSFELIELYVVSGIMGIR